jgi:probable F420-dependent oxidoreductase
MIDLGRVGVWSGGLRFGDPGEAKEAAAEFEELGYGALWAPGAAHTGTLDVVGGLLEATKAIPIATGIVNIWIEDAATIARQDAALRATYPGRFLLGVGCSHAPLIGDRYRRPVSATREYLEVLDAADPPVAVDGRVVAALGPKMLELARDRSAGSHPYLVTPAHTRIAREALGPGKLLAPEQTVVLDTDPQRAREAARRFLAIYLGMPNYTGNLKRTDGFEDADFADGGSDRLIDAAIAWGDEDAIARRVGEHLDAGADHVCIQVAGDPRQLSREPLRRLADALLSRAG